MQVNKPAGEKKQVGIQMVSCSSGSGEGWMLRPPHAVCSQPWLCGPRQAVQTLEQGERGGKGETLGLLEVLWGQRPSQEPWPMGSYCSKGPTGRKLVPSNCEGRAERQLSAAGAQQSSSAGGSRTRAELVLFLLTKPKVIYSCSAVHSPKLFTDMRGKMPQ